MTAVFSRRFVGLWRHSDFMRLWIGQTISQFGSHITREALPLAALLMLAATPSQMGLLAALGSLPPLIFALVAGVWTDRLRRRPILITADLGRCILLLIIPLAALTGHLSIGLLGAVLVLTSTLSVFFDVAYDSILPSLVSRAYLIEGNSKLASTDALSEVGGPTLSGALVQLITAPMAIFFDAVSFVISATSIALIRTPELPPAPRENGRNFRAEIVEGWHAILEHPALRTMAFARGIRSFFGNFFAALYGVYVINELRLSPTMLGVIISAGGVGSLVGAVLAGWMPKRFGLGRTLTFSALGGSLLSLLTPLAGGPPILAVTMMMIPQLVGDALSDVYTINELTLRQLVVPDHLLGRANATANFLAQAIAPVGALVAGLLGDRIGARGTLLIAILGWIVTSIWVLRSPVRDLQTHQEQQPGR